MFFVLREKCGAFELLLHAGVNPKGYDIYDCEEAKEARTLHEAAEVGNYKFITSFLDRSLDFNVNIKVRSVWLSHHVICVTDSSSVFVRVPQRRFPSSKRFALTSSCELLITQ